MTPRELLALFRLEVDDSQEPYLWSDTEFFIYLNDAQDVFLRLTGGIADSSSAVTSITYRTGRNTVKYDPRILRIKSARDEQNRTLALQNIDNFEDSPYLSDDYGGRTSISMDDGRTGDIQLLVTDYEQSTIRLYPTPDHDGSIQLYLYRRALNPITNGNSELEVMEYHHLSLLEWVKYKAYQKQDVETFNLARAESFRSNFVDYITQARAEKSGREDRKRIMRYGGIPMS